ncbi:MAG: Rrf2 family transcriptional regulator [Bacteroidota bacterium]|jgi:Rrf2 family protein|nr:Rrf2 family transcriptional regulator [Ignavibacteria bacterium]HEX2961539.1 Rrf2 family transcriptional regulator [Ignavibacteriales bacterium]MCU7498008.1 Rrf2 family transcriptional regulator [Ignavibacteria bacterium]MCU7511705.1 Rrf2 family transcriptional regulator [Ignavibacteria bacterium]MCU7519779.1 Rrf2 family transcriptional regulator [Ignavibacteria bacterium]
MKFSAQEEYGLRCLLRIGKFYRINKSLTIPEISQFEGITTHNAAKLLRILRMGGFLESERGQVGGYTLAKPPEKIILSDVLALLGGKLFEEEEFCGTHAGVENICTHSIDCSVRSLWRVVQNSVDNVLKNTTLKDLLGTEQDLQGKVDDIFRNFADMN